MLLTVLHIIGILNNRDCHFHCLQKNGKFFVSAQGKNCKIFHVDPRDLQPPQYIPNLSQCDRNLYVSKYYTPESCCVTFRTPCRESCLK